MATQQPVLVNVPTREGIPNPVLGSGDEVANQSVTKYPSGTKVIVDYNKGNEHVRVEHKGSSLT